MTSKRSDLTVSNVASCDSGLSVAGEVQDRKQTESVGVRLFVVIPTRDRPKLLARTLASLAECRQPEGYMMTIVAENGGVTGAKEVAEAAPERLQVRYISWARGNKSEALNHVVEEVGEGLIVFFDDDVRLSPDVLAAYAEAANSCGAGQFFCGPMGVDYEEPPPEWLKQHLPSSAVGWEWTNGESVNRPVAMGCNWAAFANDLRALGGFNPAFGPGSAVGATGQERDMQKRMLEAGITGRYVPPAMVWHYVPKARCSVQWALNRKYRHALRVHRKSTVNGPHLFGRPRWLVRKQVVDWLTAVRISVTSRDASRRFRAWANYQTTRAMSQVNSRECHSGDK